MAFTEDFCLGLDLSPCVSDGDGGVFCNYTSCVCPDHLSQIADFSLDPNQPCQINIYILTVLWSLQSVFWISFMVGSLGTMVMLSYKSHAVQRKFSKERMMLSVKSFTGICFAVLGILKAVQPRARLIGLDPVTTWIFCLGATSFWVDMLLFFVVQTSTHMINLAVARSKNLAFVYSRVYPILILVACVGTFTPLAILYGDPADHVKWGQIHFILLGILLFFLIFTFVLAMRIVLREIRFAMTSHNYSQDRCVNDDNNATSATTSKGSEKGGNIQQPQVTHRAQSGGSRDPRILHKLEQIEAQVVSFQRDGFFHLISGPVSVAIGISPLLFRFSCFYLPIIWSLASFSAVRYNAFSFRAIKTSNQAKPTATDSAIDSPLSAEESSDRLPPLRQGLGIINIRARRKPKWNAKMSRITEISENGSRVVSMQGTVDLTEIH